MTDDTALHERLAGWHVRVRTAMASQRLDLPFAVCIITDDLPGVYDLNLMVVTAHVPPAVLLRSIEQVAASAGWRHRRVEVDSPSIADRLRAPLTAAGYTEERFVTMALTGAPSPTVAGDGRASRPTAVVAVDAQIDLTRAVTAQEPRADSDELIDQMAERERRLARVAGGRVVLAPPGTPVSRCLLLEEPGGGLVEIDAVSTLADHRSQGWSDAVMRRALAEAHARGAEHVVLVADDADWPRTWYQRLGFTTVGRSWAFRRSPDT
ncbi:MAG TPA: GNAT family N-acetyltransferase [Euzebyales bacterium]|nr:GNAT family N-acetyltransferase [Euzebyales bacterium]